MCCSMPSTVASVDVTLLVHDIFFVSSMFPDEDHVFFGGRGGGERGRGNAKHEPQLMDAVPVPCPIAEVSI